MQGKIYLHLELMMKAGKMKNKIIVSCFACGKPALNKNTIGINKKMLGKNIKNFYCMDCLAEYLGTTTEKLEEKIEEFKEEGCRLFE